MEEAAQSLAEVPSRRVMAFARPLHLRGWACLGRGRSIDAHTRCLVSRDTNPPCWQSASFLKRADQTVIREFSNFTPSGTPQPVTASNPGPAL
jgi:hypothetical protein